MNTWVFFEHEESLAEILIFWEFIGAYYAFGFLFFGLAIRRHPRRSEAEKRKL